jgi:hypothetical protein
MNPELQFYLILSAITFALICGILQVKNLDKASRFFLTLIFVAFLSETLAFYASKTFKNNLPVYNTYSVLELTILSQYFISLKTIPVRKNGYWIAIAILLLGVINALYVQPIDSLNSYFILIEGFCIIALSLYTFYKMLLYNERLNVFRYHHFRLISLLLFYWTLTYMTWGLYDIIAKYLKEYLWLPFRFLLIANIIVYIGIGLTFISYKKEAAVNG